MVYLISYDLNKPGQDYPELYKEIKLLGSTWCHPVDSTWFVVSTLLPDQIVSRLKAVTDPSDSIIVVRATAPGAWDRLSIEASEWLKTNL